MELSNSSLLYIKKESQLTEKKKANYEVLKLYQHINKKINTKLHGYNFFFGFVIDL